MKFPEHHGRTNHIAIRYQFRAGCLCCLWYSEWVATYYQAADAFTERLDNNTAFHRFIEKLALEVYAVTKNNE